MTTAVGRIKRVEHGYLAFAEVELRVEVATELVIIAADPHSAPDAPLPVLVPAAVVGIGAALAGRAVPPCRIEVRRIVELPADTTAAAICSAAAQAAWLAFSLEPDGDLAGRLQLAVLDRCDSVAELRERLGIEPRA